MAVVLCLTEVYLYPYVYTYCTCLAPTTGGMSWFMSCIQQCELQQTYYTFLPVQWVVSFTKAVRCMLCTCSSRCGAKPGKWSSHATKSMGMHNTGKDLLFESNGNICWASYLYNVEPTHDLHVFFLTITGSSLNIDPREFYTQLYGAVLSLHASEYVAL